MAKVPGAPCAPLRRRDARVLHDFSARPTTATGKMRGTLRGFSDSTRDAPESGTERYRHVKIVAETLNGLGFIETDGYGHLKVLRPCDCSRFDAESRRATAMSRRQLDTKNERRRIARVEQLFDRCFSERYPNAERHPADVVYVRGALQQLRLKGLSTDAMRTLVQIFFDRCEVSPEGPEGMDVHAGMEFDYEVWNAPQELFDAAKAGDTAVLSRLLTAGSNSSPPAGRGEPFSCSDATA